MTTLNEGKLACTFPAAWHVTKYDDWTFYRNQFGNSCGGNKAVDFLAYELSTKTLWLIELKDYRQSRRSKEISLWDEVALKARDTLAGLFVAKVETAHPDHPYAVEALAAHKLRVVLHLEQPHTHSKLFPRIFDPSMIQQKLRQMLKPIDAHPKVIELSKMSLVPWTTTSL